MAGKAYGSKTTGNHFIVYQYGKGFYYEPTDKSDMPTEGHYSSSHYTADQALEAAQHFENEYRKKPAKV